MIQNLTNININDALHRLNEAEYGAHHLIVYPNQRVLRELYTKYVKTQLEQENKTVLVLPHYETTDSLNKILLDGSFPAAEYDRDMLEKYKNSLIVMDSIKGFFAAGSHTDFVNNLVNNAENGVLVIADGGSFFHLNKKEELMEHELSMPSRFDTDLKRFCIFHKQDFNTLAEEQRQKLLDHHGQVLVIEDK